MDALSIGRKIDIGTAVFVDGTGYTWMGNDLAHAFYDDTGTPAQLVEEHRQQRQDMLDQVFGALAGQ
jgi:hypothetical protein